MIYSKHYKHLLVLLHKSGKNSIKFALCYSNNNTYGLHILRQSSILLQTTNCSKFYSSKAAKQVA